MSQLLGISAAWPYFHRAIMESGTASFWTYLTMEAAQGSYDRVVRIGHPMLISHFPMTFHALPCISHHLSRLSMPFHR